jgi:RNA polymerase sigma-70 factor (ECF subfamily)
MAAVEVDVEEDTSSVEPEAERALLAASIEEAAAKLSPGARTVFMLHDVEGYTHEEIAAELGITAGGSKSQLFKARAKLRTLLAHMIDAPSNTMKQNQNEHVAPLY